MRGENSVLEEYAISDRLRVKAKERSHLSSNLPHFHRQGSTIKHNL